MHILFLWRYRRMRLITRESVVSKRLAYRGSDSPGEFEAELFFGLNTYGWTTSCSLALQFWVGLSLTRNFSLSLSLSLSLSPSEENEQEMFKSQLLSLELLLGLVILHEHCHLLTYDCTCTQFAASRSSLETKWPDPKRQQ